MIDINNETIEKLYSTFLLNCGPEGQLLSLWLESECELLGIKIKTTSDDCFAFENEEDEIIFKLRFGL
jgi:hypothetical protein